MRLSLRLSNNSDPVPFNHLETLLQTLSRWLDFDLPSRNGVGLYSFGWLEGANKSNGELSFLEGATWRISFFNAADAHRALAGIAKDPHMAFGMQVESSSLQPPPDFHHSHRFLTDLGPIINRRQQRDGSFEYLIWRHKASDRLMTNSLRKRLERIGYPGADMVQRVSFDRSYRKAHTKLITFNGVDHRGSICPVHITGSEEALAFAWATGIGDLTDKGFGALR
jgi:CRISPR-associated endoribonuclease Cas6